MKRTSLVLLIIAGVLLVAGIILCLCASNLAEKDGGSLYDTTTEVREEDGARIFDFTSKDVTRIKVAMTNTDIRIMKSDSDKSYAELFNFSTGTFDIGVSNRLLTVTNKSGFSELLGGDDKSSFSLENFSFKGLRYFLRFTTAGQGRPRVDIYLSEHSAVKIIDVASEGGTVLIRDRSMSGDYDISSVKGDITLENVSSDSTVKLTASDCDAILKKTSLSACNATVINGSLTGEAVTIGIMTGSVSSGDIDIEMTGKLPEYRYFLKAPEGVVTIDKKETGKRSSTDNGFGYMQLVSANGNISVTSGEIAKDALNIKVDEKLIAEKIKNFDDSLGKNEYE